MSKEKSVQGTFKMNKTLKKRIKLFMLENNIDTQQEAASLLVAFALDEKGIK